MTGISSLLDFISKADTSALLAINGANTPFLDAVMWTVSGKWIWIPFYMLLAGLIVKIYGIRYGFICLIAAAALTAATDQTCASLIRPLAARLRPSSPDNPVSGLIHIVNGYHGGRYGFPSCHAANSFALALFLSLLFRNKGAACGLITWSLLVSYSRLYLGVHYPGDILAGIAVGGAYALIFHSLARRIIAASPTTSG